MSIDTSNIPAKLYDASLPTPNVYFVTVNHALQGVHTLYIAADSAGAAIQKVRVYCRDSLGFMPYRSTSNIRLRRFRLGDYLENPQGLQAAGENAALAHERDTVAALSTRHQEVQALIAELATAQQETADMNYAALEAQLGDALRAASA